MEGVYRQVLEHLLTGSGTSGALVTLVTAEPTGPLPSSWGYYRSRSWNCREGRRSRKTRFHRNGTMAWQKLSPSEEGPVESHRELHSPPNMLLTFQRISFPLRHEVKDDYSHYWLLLSPGKVAILTRGESWLLQQLEPPAV